MNQYQRDDLLEILEDIIKSEVEEYIEMLHDEHITPVLERLKELEKLV